MSSIGTLLIILLSQCSAKERHVFKKAYSLNVNCTDGISNSCCGVIPSQKFRAEGRQTNCILCPVGTYCLSGRCSFCAECEAGLEARNRGSTNCSECARGYFKAHRGSGLCTPCPAGHFANGTGQVQCTQCPTGNYCEVGAVKPLPCASYCLCPPGTGTPMDCDPSWRTESDYISPALIVVICLITVPIAIAVIALIIYRLYKYCKRRRYSENSGETEPLLTGIRPGSRLLQEPVYTGL